MRRKIDRDTIDALDDCIKALDRLTLAYVRVVKHKVAETRLNQLISRDQILLEKKRNSA